MRLLNQTNTLFNIINAAFCVIVVISNIISFKILRLPFLSDHGIPAGLLTFPLTFLLSDLTTEIYGPAKAKIIVYTALGMTLLSYLLIQAALFLPSWDLDNQQVFQSALGVNGLIIFASLSGYTISQLIDIQLYALIKKWTGSKMLWLRNNVSTLISQIADTFTVSIIHLYWGLGMEFDVVLHMILFSYMYKAFFSVANTPIFYFCVYLINRKKMAPLSYKYV